MQISFFQTLHHDAESSVCLFNRKLFSVCNFGSNLFCFLYFSSLLSLIYPTPNIILLFSNHMLLLLYSLSCIFFIFLSFSTDILLFLILHCILYSRHSYSRVHKFLALFFRNRFYFYTTFIRLVFTLIKIAVCEYFNIFSCHVKLIACISIVF